MIDWLRRKDPGRPSLVGILYYSVCRWFVWLAFRLVYRLRRTGTERIPQGTPLLAVANHQSHLDPPLIGASITHRHLVFIARSGLFRFKPFAWLINSFNAIPIRENQGDAVAIRTAIDHLRAGRMVLIFPEGTRSPDGAMRDFKRGAWLLMSRAKCPILPVAVEGCFDAWPREQKFPALFGKRVAVEFGEPIPYETLIAMGPDEGLAYLARTIDAMRLRLRTTMRERSGGRYPLPGPGDAPSSATV